MAITSKAGKRRNKDLRDMMARIAKMSDEERDNALDALRLAINSEKIDEDWRIRAIAPNHGPVAKVLRSFNQETDIPLELPFFCVVHLLSGLLLDKGASIDSKLGNITPEIWTILLAPSGAGKTLTHNTIAKSAPISSQFPECASSAAFFNALKSACDERKYGLWFQDEFAQMLKQIETPNSPLSEMKSYLLRAYGNDRIVRTTLKQGELVIEEPRIGILALNTVESFVNAISMESMLDGFAQRFGLIVAKEDPKRHITDFPTYDLETIGLSVSSFWEAISQVEIHSNYTIDKSAMELYDDLFKRLFVDDMSKSFYRRIMFKVFKYALIYHILLCKNSSELDEEDLAFAMDLTKVHLQDMTHFICLKEGVRNVVDIGKKAKWVIETKKRQGASVKPRDLVIGCRHDLGKVDEAKFLLDVMEAELMESWERA